MDCTITLTEEQVIALDEILRQANADGPHEAAAWDLMQAIHSQLNIVEGE